MTALLVGAATLAGLTVGCYLEGATRRAWRRLRSWWRWRGVSEADCW